MFEYIREELKRLDLMIHREILKLRARYQSSTDELRGLYITDEQVEALVTGDPANPAPCPELTARAEALRAATLVKRPPEWQHLASCFALSDFEYDTLLLALAPEIHSRYETLYAYLHDDVARRSPSCDLALRICCPAAEQRLAMQRLLMDDSALFRDGLLIRTNENHRFFRSEFAISIPVLRFLTGATPPNRFLPKAAPYCPQPEFSALLHASANGRGYHVLETNDVTYAEALIEQACDSAGVPLIAADALDTVRDLVLTQRLWCCGILIRHADIFFSTDQASPAIPRHTLETLGRLEGPVWMCLPPGTPWRETLACKGYQLFPPIESTYPVRRDALRVAARNHALPFDDPSLDELAVRFSLSVSQIERAVSCVIESQKLFDAPIDMPALTAAFRSQMDSGLGRLATLIRGEQRWEDLVLPSGTRRQLEEITAAIQNRHRVFESWGFGARSPSAAGLKVLFAGVSGTGKTMTAGVIGHGLGLDVYRIDLSSVVSKYIGETEKNLGRIFRAAAKASAILFFDEADALFGKRSEVKDAHDRYANIEVAYLLQELEEHAGVVIMATNLRRNIDDAFARRMHYVVEFPLPDEEQRKQLWRKVFPLEAPVSPDVDFAFLARQFAISGGDIRNVALDAAFLAARDGQVINMQAVTTAMARQMVKQGRVPSASDFRSYHSLIASALIARA